MGKTFRNNIPINDMTPNEVKIPSVLDSTLNYVNHESEVPTTQYEFKIPNGTTNLRPYFLYESPYHINVKLNNDVITLGDYAFYGAPNVSIMNFDEMTALTTIGEYSFAHGNCAGIDLSALPSSLTTIKAGAFNCSIPDGMSINIPSSITSIGSHAFQGESKRHLNQLTFPTNFRVNFAEYCFENDIFDCDFVAPSRITSIPSRFNYGGSFNNIVFPLNCQSVSASSFYGPAADAPEDYHLKSVTFKHVHPPNIGKNAFALQHVQNGMKIYVPDGSEDEYKAFSTMTQYADIIFPVSQKPVDPAKTQYGDNFVTVTLNAGEGTSPVSSVVEEYGTLWHDLPVATREGYTFDGWYTERNHKRENGMPCRNYEPFTLYAHWTANT